MYISSAYGLAARYSRDLDLNTGAHLKDRSTPAMPGEAVVDSENVSCRNDLRSRHLKILAIDDNENALTILNDFLVAFNQTVFSFRSGQKAVETFRCAEIDLVISDLCMPGMSGWDVGLAVKSICYQKGIRKTPFILLTAMDSYFLETGRLSESGVDYVVEKPFGFDDMINTICSLTHSRQTSPTK